jgi:uncharacterized damage-inducible protein DinB
MRRVLAGSPVIAPLLASALLALPALPAPSAAAAQTKPAAAQAKPTAAALPTGLRADVLGQLAVAERRLTALAQAIPAEKFTWRPGPGVRSVGELFLHVAGANYDIATVWGVNPPAGSEMDAARGIGKGGADRNQAIAALRASFDHLRKAITALTDKDLDREIDFFGRKGTVHQALVEAAVHPHEHLGQAIAYARINGIVPPWTAAQ